jgi:hypothetical protein
MTQSILPRSDRRTDRTDTAPEPPGRSHIITGVWICTGAAGTTGVATATIAVASDTGLSALIVSCTAFVIAAIGSSLLVFNSILPSCREYYRRGHLEGWMRGWRGQPPENDVPGLN